MLVFCSDNFCRDMAKSYISALSEYETCIEFFIPPISDDDLLLHNLPYEEDAQSDVVIKYNIPNIAQYSLTMYKNEEIGIYNSLYGNFMAYEPGLYRIKTYLQWLYITFKQFLLSLSSDNTVLIMPEPVLASRKLCLFIAKELGFKVVSISTAPFYGFVLIDNGQPYQTGTLASLQFKDYIDCINPTEDEITTYYQWKEVFISSKQTRGCDSEINLDEANSVALPSEYILVTGQNPTDANQIIHQLDIRYDPIQLIHLLLCHRTYMPIMFKKHPEDTSTTADLLRWTSRVYVIESNVNIHDLLPKATHVLTWNSNVGIEALVYHKPVIVLGQAFYRNIGITCDLKNYCCLPDALRFQPDIAKIDKYLCLLTTRFLTSVENYGIMYARIKSISERGLL